MRKKMIGFIILLVALALLTIGIIEAEFELYSSIYAQMASIP
jgi:hypothetical protein